MRKVITTKVAEIRRAPRPLALLAAFLVAVGSIVALPTIAHAATTELEAPDYASQNFNDPWDYSNGTDINSDFVSASNANITGGKLEMDVKAGDAFSPLYSIPGSLATGRDGAAHPINADYYNHMSFSLSQPASGTGAVYWFTCRNMTPDCAGLVYFNLTPGDHVYDLNLPGLPNHLSKPWSGSIVGLTVIPAFNLSQSTAHMSFDWMRVYRADSSLTDAAYPAGTYGSVIVEARPRVVLDSPTANDGPDLPQVQRGGSWDFTNPANGSLITYLHNANFQGYGSSGITAVNNNSSGDPQLGLAANPFDANTYHLLSFDMSYDGPFSLAEGAGGGKLARLIWNTSTTGIPQDSNDMVTFDGANAGLISVNLTAGDPLDENSRAPRVGWGGQTITSLRFDPNEDTGANTWHVKSVHLRADPVGAGSTPIRFHDDTFVAGATADISVGTSQPGSAGWTTLAAGVAVSAGVNTYNWNLGGMPTGAYYVKVVLHHPSGSTGQIYSTVPVHMTADNSGDPKGSFDTVRRSPGGVTVQGWAFDRDQSSPLEVRAYVDGSFASSFTTSVPRPDVVAGNSSAPANSGFSGLVPVASGRHSVCLYGINQGGGNNSTIGCQAVVVSGAAIGSLDRAIPVPGGIRATGWALDPDTASSIRVDSYTGTTGSPVIASLTRGDIGASFPDYGNGHGYRTDLPRAPGNYQVCSFAIGTAGDDNSNIGCRTVAVGTNSPLGSLDGVTRVSGGVQVSGWALDPDSASPTRIDVYVNGVGGSIFTSTTRADVNASYPDWAGNHGFSSTIAAPAGATVCAYAIDAEGLAGNTSLGCRSA